MTLWKTFKSSNKIRVGSAEEVYQLYECCEKNLQKLLIRENPDILERPESEALEAIKRFAVNKVAISVRRTCLLSMKQQHGETFREYYANVRASADACNFKIKCHHACCTNLADIDYTSLVVKDVIITGIQDTDIRKDVLAWGELDKKDDKDVVTFVESKEIAQAAFSGSSPDTGTNAGISTNKRAQKQDGQQVSDPSIKQKLALRGNCKKCKVEISLYKRYQSGKMNATAFTLCRKCHRENSKSENASVGKPSEQIETNTASVESFLHWWN